MMEFPSVTGLMPALHLRHTYWFFKPATVRVVQRLGMHPGI
jgi:hypothetical protein